MEKLTRIVEWTKTCECGYWEKGESEYLGLNFWFCTKCQGSRLSGTFRVKFEMADKGE